MNTSFRTASRTVGYSLLIMAILAPVGLIWALPEGETGVAALTVLIVAMLDIVAGVAFFPLLRSGGELLAASVAALRIAYGAAFTVGAGFLVTPVNEDRFHAIWEMALFLFGAHLVLAGIAVIRTVVIPTWIGALVVIAGLGYAIDAISVAVRPENPLGLTEVAFVGEVVLLIWCIGWGGRRQMLTADRDLGLAERRIQPTELLG